MSVSSQKEMVLSQANDVLTSIITDAGKLKDFMVGEVPSVVHEFLVWGIIDNTISIGICMMFFFINWYCAKKTFMYYDLAIQEEKERKEKGDDVITSKDNELLTIIHGVIAVITSGVNIFGLIWIFFDSLKSLLVIALAPRVYLIKYAIDAMN
jgi:sterol desaturase/sphingolipid hydroxylase (fatty acid hydroxylase superfamily)